MLGGIFPSARISLWSSAVDLPVYMASRVESLIRRSSEVGDPRAAPTSSLGYLHQSWVGLHLPIRNHNRRDPATMVVA